jgi:hypothetical protein
MKVDKDWAVVHTWFHRLQQKLQLLLDISSMFGGAKAAFWRSQCPLALTRSPLHGVECTASHDDIRANHQSRADANQTRTSQSALAYLFSQNCIPDFRERGRTHISRHADAA